ncbi:Mutual gliding-motility protein MglA [compost metagenome]
MPGQVEYNASRKLILNGVDGIVFVADSQTEKMQENIESLRNMEENLAEYGLTLDSVPYVLQYNKRDLPNVNSFEELEGSLNDRGVPSFEAVAVEGSGVFATLKAVSKAVLNRLS